MKNNFKLYLRILISIFLIAFLGLQIQMTDLVESLKSVRLWTLPISTVLVLAQIYFLSLRWHLFLNVRGDEIPFQISVLSNVAGYFSNIILVTSVGGAIVKSAMAVKYGLSFTRAIFIAALDRFMSLLSLVVFSIVALPLLYNALDHRFSINIGIIMFGFMAMISIILYVLKSGLLNNYFFSSKTRSRFLAIIRLYLENAKLMKLSVLYSVIAQLCFFFSVWVLLFGFEDTGINTLYFLALLPVISLVAALPISVGGWGVREGVFMFGLGLIGLDSENAFLLSIQVGLIGVIAPVIVTLLYVLFGQEHLYRAISFKRKKIDGTI